MRKKRKKEVVHVEVDRQLPVKPIDLPSVENLNRMMEQMLAAERRRAMQTFGIIVAALVCIFAVLLGGMSWFTRDIMRQLQAERRLSEKSREDMLNLIYSGHTPMTITPPASAGRPPDSVTPQPAATRKPPAASEPQPAAPPAATALPAAAMDQPAPLHKKNVDVHITDDLTLRLPIPTP